MSKSTKTHAELADMTLGHLARSGTDDIFRPPALNRGIELEEFQKQIFRDALRRCVVNFLKSPSVDGFSPLIRFSVPKTRNTYRHASLIDIEDLSRYTALVFKIASHIEAHRVPVADQVVFSSRFQEADDCIIRTTNYDGFREKSGELSRDLRFKAKVLSDISNFYDRLNLHRLQSVLLEIGCDPDCVNALDQILLHWAGRNSYGLPVGGDASRILAEAMLINVDKHLLSKGITFVRYVDDYRIFSDSFSGAHRALALLTDALDKEGLFINSEKTKILHCGSEADDEILDKTDFKSIDESEKIAIIKRITSSYRTRISTTYIEPGKEAIANLQKVNIVSLVDEMLADNVEESRLRFFIKAFIYGTNHDVALLLRVLDRHVHMLRFCVSALIAESQRIGPTRRAEMALRFEEYYEELGHLSYYKLCVARLLSNDHFFRPGVFGRWFEKLPINADTILVRELITFFRSKLTRQDILILVEYSKRCPPAVRRAIMKAALESNACQRGERRAWATVWRKANNVAFTTSICCNFLYPGRVEAAST